VVKRWVLSLRLNEYKRTMYLSTSAVAVSTKGRYNNCSIFTFLPFCLLLHCMLVAADHQRRSRHRRQPTVRHQLPQLAPTSLHLALLSLHRYPVPISRQRPSTTPRQTSPLVPWARAMLRLLLLHWTMALWCIRRPTDSLHSRWHRSMPTLSPRLIDLNTSTELSANASIWL